MKKTTKDHIYFAEPVEQQQRIHGLMQNEIEELKDAVRYLELQLVEKKREQEGLMRELEAAHTHAHKHEGNYKRETTITQTQAGKLADLERKFKEHKESQQEIINRARDKIADYQGEINSREEELAGLKARLHQKAEELKVAEIGMVANRNKALETIDESQRKTDEISKLKQEIYRLKQELLESQAERRSEGTALLEVEHLKADNDRLIKLLQGTKEYKNFSKFAMDNLGSVRFMPNIKKKKCAVTHCGANTLKENVAPNFEEENWIPQEAFDVAYSFKKQYGGELTDTLINKLLKTLNLVWRDREKRQIARVKNNCNHQIQKLRRQITNTAPLSEVNTKNEIWRLKQQLNDSQKKLRQNIAQKNKNLRQTEITDHVEAAFKVAGDLQDERNKVIQENKILKVRLKDAEKLRDSEDYERAKFMQGAAWQATKSMNESKELEGKVDTLIADFKAHERNLYLKGDTAGLQLFRQKNHEIVLEEIQEVIKETGTNFKKMMEVATENFSTSQGQVDILG